MNQELFRKQKDIPFKNKLSSSQVYTKCAVAPLVPKQLFAQDAPFTLIKERVMQFNQPFKVFGKVLVAAALTLPTAALFNVSSALADPRDATVQNATDLKMTALYVSSTRSSNWGNNRLPHSLESGDSFELRFTNNSTHCVYDVKAVYEDDSYDRTTENLCEKSTLYYYGYGGDHR